MPQQPALPEETNLYRFGVFELDLERWQLRREGREVPLQDQPLRLLQALLETPGAVVGRESLRQRLWEPGTHVDFEGGINSAVRRLREALQDGADNPRFIQTVPRRGYRFIAPVEAQGPVEARPAAQGDVEEAPPPSTFRLPPATAPWPWLAVGLILGGVFFFALRMAPSESPSSGRVGGPGSSQPGSLQDLVDTHFQRARLFADRRSQEGIQKAIAEYQSALAADPDRAESYAGLATAYVMLGAYDYWRPRDAFEPARRMAERALELDESSPEALMALSTVTAMVDWDWAGAETRLDRALALDPSLTEGHLWRAILLSYLGRHQESLASIERALALEPVSPVLNTAKAWLLFYARQPDEAVRQSHQTIELAPDYYDAWDNLKWILLTSGDHAEAVRAWARAETLNGGNGPDLLERFSREGLPPLLRSSIEKKLHLDESRYSSPFDLVLDYTTLGRTQEALDWLERSFAERETDLLGLAVDPRLDQLRNEPRFQDILSRLRIAPSSTLGARPPESSAGDST